MKKEILLTTVLLAMVLLLSSCAVNVFKPFNNPKSITKASQDALAAADSGDSQSALALSNSVIATVAGTSTSGTNNLYNALTSSSTSEQSKKVIEETAMSVQKVKEKLQNGEISPTSTEGVAVKNAALAMERSILKVKKIGLSNTLSKIFGLLEETSNNSQVSAYSATFDATKVSQILTLVFSINTDAPTTNLMGRLCALLSSYGGNDAFNWNTANAIYDVLYNFTTLFDSNEDGKLDQGDTIYQYIWDSKKNKFKSEFTQETIKQIDEVQLATYGNLSLSEEVVNKLADLNVALNGMSQNLPESLQSYSSSLSEAIKYLNKISTQITAAGFSKLKNVIDLALYIVKIAEGGK